MAITVKVIECSISKADFEELLKRYVPILSFGKERHYVQLNNDELSKFNVGEIEKHDIEFGKANRLAKEYTFKYSNKNLELFLMNKDIYCGSGSSKFILKDDFLNPLEKPSNYGEYIHFVLINF